MFTSRLRLITFDVTDTLLKFRLGPGQQYGEVGAMYGILCDNDSLSANFKAQWRKMNKDHPNFGLHSGLGWELWWKILVKGTFKDSKFHLQDQRLEAVTLHLIDVYKTSACWQLGYGVSALLSYIRSKGIPMGVISNFDPRLNQVLINLKLRHYFQFVLSSYEVGIEKPDSKIFQKAIYTSQLKQLKPEECLHVGDKISLDYQGARSSGWQAVLIYDGNAKEIKERYPDVDTKHVFPSLFHLHKYFVETVNDEISLQSL